MDREITHPKLHDPEWLREQIDAEVRVSTIARMIGCTPGAVNDRLQKYGIQHAHSRHQRTVCQYCGGDYTPGTVEIHAARCRCNPQVRQATIALLDDGDGCIVTLTEYRQRHRQAGETCAMSVAGIRSQIGGWANVAAEFGLLDDEGKILRDIDREREAALERMAEERELNRGLPVCRVRQLDGGGVAFMLR